MKKFLSLTLLAIIFSIASYAIPAITGATGICVGSSAYLVDSTTPSGTWTSSNTTVATIGLTSGIVYGVATGTTTITYSTSAGFATETFTVSTAPIAITGVTTICAGTTSNLSEAVSGGTWSSGNTGIATISSTGVVSGVSGGSAYIYYTTGAGCNASVLVNISTTTVDAITGPFNVCAGSSVTVMDSTVGGVWSSSNTSVATINPASGDAYGVSTGTTTITYTGTICSSAYTTATFTVSAAPSAISGTATICAGSTSQLSDTTPGGTWSSSYGYVATVTSGGLVTGVHSGTADIYYSTGSGCMASMPVTINAITPSTITGPASVCAAGGTIHLTDSTSGGSGSGGVWSSSNTSIATIGTSGTVTGIAVGTVTITYSVAGSCGTGYVTATINVINTTSPGIISGTSTVNTGGATATLYETVSGGVWSSSNAAIATINASTGIYTGVSVGTSVITYTVSGCGGTATATYTVTVTTINGISGFVNFTGGAYYGNIKVWLITYNSSTLDLEAIDSNTYSVAGNDSIYYQFLGDPTDSYRVKAAPGDTAFTTGTSGYIPTYHTSSFYWDYADVINHTAGTADTYKDINMMIGTPTTGPGFIGGNVTAGANRGTSTGIPVVGMNVYLLNSTTNALIQSAVTDATGSYSFSNLPVGTYYVFPDSLNYFTTAYTGITLTSGAATMSAADFVQHTVLKTITPVNEGVSNISNIVSSVIAFPNPTNGKLNLQWNEQATEKGNVSITDVTGREIYKTAINMNQGTGVKQLDLSGLINGLYIVSVKSGSINYNTKIQVQH